MARYVGLDLHKRFIVACALNEDGSVAFRTRFNCSSEGIVRFAREHLSRQDAVALEVTTHSQAVAQLLVPFVARVVVSNPTKTKAIAAATVKTDAVDAKTLAQLLRSDFLPEVWQPDPESETLRSLVTFRSQLAGTRTRYQNRIRSILQQLMLELPSRRLDAAQARRALEEGELPETERLQVDTLLTLIDETDRSITEVDEPLARFAYASEPIKLLMTLPGMGMLAACAVYAAIGDITRFRSSNHLVAYLGLAPRVKQSAGHTWYGSITKTGNREARRLLVLAAGHLTSDEGPLGDFYRRLKTRKHGSVAAVAAARKIAEVIYHMLSNNEPYRYAAPQRTLEKLDRLRAQATGQRRERQPIAVAPKNEPQTPKPENSRRCAVRALNEVYRLSGLPPIDWAALKEGEKRVTQPFEEYVDSLKRNYAYYRKIRAEVAATP